MIGLAALVVIAAVVVVVAVASGGDDKGAKTTAHGRLEDPNPDNKEFHMGADANPFAGAAPLTIKFSADTFRGTPGGKVKYYWRFDDGTTSTQQSPTHTFKEAGYYTVLVNVRDDHGHKDGFTLITGAWPAALWTTTQHRRLSKAEQLKAVREQSLRTKRRRDRLQKEGKGALIAPTGASVG
jgi:hypothetical protein